MANIEGIRIKNYKTLKDVTLGKLLGSEKGIKPLSPLTVVIGKNGVGKSTLFDAFGFLADAVKLGVEDACEKRGGFAKIRSRECDGPIEFEIYYRENKNARPITYELAIDLDKNNRPIVKKERLRQRRKGETHGRPYSFLILENGIGVAWKGTDSGLVVDELTIEGLLRLMNGGESSDQEKVELNDPRKLGITTLGSLKQHPRISAFIRFIDGWYLSYFRPDAVRTSLPLAGPQKHLNVYGDNISNVVQYMEREHRTQFQFILQNIAKKIPGIHTITTEKTPDGRLLLRFNNTEFKEPFYAGQMSDGTLKVFAYLILIHDPNPPSFLCIEEPENGVYHKLLEILADEFRKYTDDAKKHSQVFITTHQPYFVNALNPSEVWIMDKGQDGFSTLRRASEDQLVCDLVSEGMPLGNLWYSEYLDK